MIEASIYRSLTYLFLFFVTIGASANDGSDMHFRHLTPKQGLSNPKVLSITQDYLGYIWIGTENGLNRFDSHTAIRYHHNPNNRRSISGNHISHIHEDTQTNLWVFTENGVNIYNRTSNDFEQVPFIGNDSSQTYFKVVWGVSEDKSGTLWVTTSYTEVAGNLIYHYDSEKRAFVPYLNYSLEYLRTLYLNAIHFDRQGDLWVGSYGHGLLKLNWATRKLDPFFAKEKTEIHSIAECADGIIWFTSYNGLYAYNPNTNETRIYKHNPNDPQSISSNNLMKVLIDSYGSIWIGTDDGGLNRLNRMTDRFDRYSHSEFINHSLINDRSIRAIFEDRQRNLWVGTGFGGVSYAEIDRDKKFDFISRNPALPNTLSFDAVSAVIEDQKGNLWIGTDGGGLNRYNPRTGIFKHYRHSPANPESIAHDVVLSLLEDSKGCIWVGTYYGGICRLNPTNGSFDRLYKEGESTESRRANDVRDFIEDSEGYIWAATNGGGILKIDPRSFKIIEHITSDANSSNTLSSNWALSIIEDSNRNIWVTSYWGITLYNRKENRLIPYYGIQGDTTTLPHNWVFDAIEDSQGHIWFATGGGLAQHLGNGTFRTFNPTEISVGAMRSLVEDTKGNFWIGTHQGILRFNPKNKTFRHFNKNNGLPAVSYTSATYRGRNGQLYFASNEGLTMFYPQDIRINLKPLTTIISNLLINYSPAIPNQPGSPLSESIYTTSSITLSHKQNTLTLEFIAFDYSGTGLNRYSYTLEGFDQDWHTVDSKREVTYTNIPPGSYSFQVKAANPDGIWNPESTNLEIIITPPYWQTFWFRAVISILLFITIITAHNIRLLSIRNRTRDLERAVEERTSELVEKNEELETQANELNEVNTLLEERHQMIEEQAEHLAAQKQELETQKSSLEAANSQLQDLIATKDKFFSIIAHDLKSPFNVLLGFSELLIENQEKYDKASIIERVKLINESSKKVYNLLLNLLEWSRTQRGMIEPNHSVFNFKDLMLSNIDLIKENLTKKSITIDTNSIVPPHELFADRDLINTVVRNLLSNALKFTPSNGSIHIKSWHKDQVFHFSITDSGIGINKESIENIFTVGRHSPREGTNNEQGTGLGLIICKEFIDLHRGRITVESQEGKGSTFLISIPQKIQF